MRSIVTRTLIAFSLLALMASLLAGCAKQGEKYPTKAIEYVCQASAGGSSDKFVRSVVKALEDQKLISVPISVANKAGGGGAIAFNYVKGKEGDPYFLLNTSGNFIAANLRDPSVPGHKDFTPICRFAFDLNTVIVSANSPYKTMADLVNAAKANPGKINWAGTSVGSQDHLTVLTLQRVSGTKFSFVSFTGSNEVLAALLGGHVQVGCAEPWVAKAQADAGKVRILGLGAEARLKGLPDVPTLKEQGYDVVVYMQRGVVAAGKIPESARKYLVNAFTKLGNSQAWKDFLANEGLMEGFLAGDDYAKFLAEETAKWQGLLKEAGVIK
ncbi:MAG TPA: tripartite tricarboxylate transporter substrate binding protein [Bacillota bacterium]|jgi:putative tricarboxylic transport membrane protein